MKVVKPEPEAAMTEIPMTEAPAQDMPEQVTPRIDGSKPIAPSPGIKGKAEPKPLNRKPLDAKPLVRKPEAKRDHGPAVRILKIGTCLSVSGKSTLTYHVGCTPESEIRLRISANSGGGFFSQEWISLASIQEALNRQPDGQAITSFSLRGLFRGKSVNTAGFVMAVLKHVGLVKHMKEKERCYESVDPAPFIAEMETLIKSAVDLPVAASKKPAVKGKAV